MDRRRVRTVACLAASSGRKLCTAIERFLCAVVVLVSQTWFLQPCEIQLDGIPAAARACEIQLTLVASALAALQLKFACDNAVVSHLSEGTGETNLRGAMAAALLFGPLYL